MQSNNVKLLNCLPQPIAGVQGGLIVRQEVRIMGRY